MNMEIKRPESAQPIPDHAKKVFDGVVFDVYQWEQELFDGSKAVFEKIKRLDTVMIIPVMSDGKIILLNQQQPGTNPILCLPGGRIEKSEEVLSSAKRELLEETGCESDDFVLWDAIQPVGKIEWAIYTFIAKNCKKVAGLNLDSGEKIELKYVSFDEFIDIVLHNKDFRDYEVKWKLLDMKDDVDKMAELRKLFLG